MFPSTPTACSQPLFARTAVTQLNVRRPVWLSFRGLLLLLLLLLFLSLLGLRVRRLLLIFRSH